MRWFTASRCRYRPRCPRRVLKPSASMSTVLSNSSRDRLRYGYAAWTSSNSASSDHSSAATQATICCARISSGLSGITNRSSSPRLAASMAAMHSTSSSRDSGNSLPLGIPPTWWLALPTRCSSVLMARGEPICTTRSIAPMSIPSSSDAVATSADRLPSFSLVSASSRCSAIASRDARSPAARQADRSGAWPCVRPFDGC